MKRIRKIIQYIKNAEGKKKERYAAYILGLCLIAVFMSFRFGIMDGQLANRISMVFSFLGAVLGVIVEIILWTIPKDDSE